ncbi:MAG: DUF3667 domain-containing protein [Bacteroidales bacterium]|nr:DUF3667 domain-containing protein [Bacteroidales bacterium]
MKKERLLARVRAFTIWQKNGFLPWSKPKDKTKNGSFYKGAFDSIPFLNEDAKRTFTHLLLRPGHMIRDYIKGQHERYLAPLTSLIIFYAFFALVSSIVHPDFSNFKEDEKAAATVAQVDSAIRSEADSVGYSVDLELGDNVKVASERAIKLSSMFMLLSLDKHPELVDTPLKASLAALESSLRSQGVYLFLGYFLILWIAMWWVLRKRGMSISACAATAAYVLCQFCFFMFFSLFLSKGHEGEIGVGLMGLLLTVDYHQLFGLGWKKSIKLSIKTGVFYGLTIALLSVLLAGLLILGYTLFS